MPALIFRKAFDLKNEVAGALAASYRGDLVQTIKAADYHFQAGRLAVLGGKFGFCYGVDRAVDYAYQARRQYRRSRSFLPAKSSPARERSAPRPGIRFLSDPGDQWDRLGASDDDCSGPSA